MKIVITESCLPYRDFIAAIPGMMERREGTILHDGRNLVCRLEHDGQVFIAKRYKRPNFFQRIVYTCFRPTKAARAYRFAHEFRERGIGTPEEIAYMEVSRHGLFHTGYFVCHEATGNDTYQALVNTKTFPEELAAAVADHVVAMHQKGILHGDLNLTNFLYHQDSHGISFNMIDLNRSHFTEGWPSYDQCLDNLKRITHRRDLFDFIIRHYAQRRGWEETSTLIDAYRYLNKLERKEQMKHRLSAKPRR